MIKDGFTLYATKANGRWFIKQAKSARQFVAICVADERRAGFAVVAWNRHTYLPDFAYDEKAGIWRWADGRPYGKDLPPGAR